jgi:malate synthase
VRINISVTQRYLTSWFGGNGAAGVFNLMEDVATAEICRSQLWQWLHCGASMSDGRTVTRELVARIEDEEATAFRAEIDGGSGAQRFLDQARTLFAELVFSDRLAEFLTMSGYDLLA